MKHLEGLGMKFESYKLSELVQIIGGGTPKRKVESYWNGDIPWLSVKDFNDKKRWVHQTDETITEKGLNESSTKLLKTGDLIISARGTVGEIAQLAKPMAFNQSCYGLRAHELLTTNDYLYYWIRYNVNYVKNNTHGSVFDTITRNTFDNLIVKLPPKEYQNKVVKVLTMIDKKIELNNAIISNLEELAQTLFKRWFVDFEFPNEEGKPYKSSGGKMVESELGMIPKGWDIGNLNYFIHETMNGDWGKAEAEKNHQFPVNIIRGADLPELRFGRDGKPPKRFILEKNFKKKSLRNGDVIVEISGGSPTQSTGRTLFVDQNILKKFDNKVVSTNFCRVLRPSIEEHGIFVHTYFAYLYNNGVFFNYENGTTGIKNLDIKSVLEELKVVLPDETILNKFNSLVYILLNSIQKLGDENSKLEAIRDTLLPKLLSGEIELPDDMEVTDDVPIS